MRQDASNSTQCLQLVEWHPHYQAVSCTIIFDESNVLRLLLELGLRT